MRKLLPVQASARPGAAGLQHAARVLPRGVAMQVREQIVHAMNGTAINQHPTEFQLLEEEEMFFSH